MLRRIAPQHDMVLWASSDTKDIIPYPTQPIKGES
jgi:hypothetical protein